VPTASSNGPVCENGTLNLSALNIANATYNWTGPNDLVLPNKPHDSSATTTASGSYSVIATVNGCTSVPSVVSVIVNQLSTITLSSAAGTITNLFVSYNSVPVLQNIVYSVGGSATGANVTGLPGGVILITTTVLRLLLSVGHLQLQAHLLIHNHNWCLSVTATGHKSESTD
jgi:hypothetical protein